MYWLEILVLFSLLLEVNCSLYTDFNIRNAVTALTSSAMTSDLIIRPEFTSLLKWEDKCIYLLSLL